MSWARGGARLSPTRGGQLGRLRQSRGVLRRAEDTIPEHPLALPGRGGAVHPLTCLGRCEGPLLLVWEEEDVWWPGRSRGGETGHLAGAPSLSLTCWGPPCTAPPPRHGSRTPEHRTLSSPHTAAQPGARSTSNQPEALPRPPYVFVMEAGPQESLQSCSPQSGPITSWAARKARVLPEGMVTVFFRLRWPWPLP